MPMDLQLLRNKLEIADYASFITGDTLIGGQVDSVDTAIGGKLLKKTFSIEIKKDILIIEYSQHQVPLEKEFTSVNLLVDFVRKEFPIKSE